MLAKTTKLYIFQAALERPIESGTDLAESTGGVLDPWFQTARLWGLADTAPYLHDGRATTLSEAILLHGGEGEEARGAFEELSDGDKEKLLTFLRTLRTPRQPNRDLRPRNVDRDDDDD